MNDHKAEAKICIDSSHRQRLDGLGPTEAIKAGLYMLQAQVHATLYLAEQQRLANLIALAAHEPGKSEAYWRALLSNPVNEMALELKPEIREALGL